jgi:hypothetical protein
MNEGCWDGFLSAMVMGDLVGFGALYCSNAISMQKFGKIPLVAGKIQIFVGGQMDHSKFVKENLTE